MTGKFGKTFSFSGLLMSAAASILFVMSAATDASAWHNGHSHGGGGLLPGAIIGGAAGAAIGGKKGILPGVIIGGAVGAAASSQARRAPPPQRYYQPAPRQPVYQDSLVYNIQLSLTKLGYNPGPVDGVYGQRTADAISAYEYNNQLPVTGQVSGNVYSHMKQMGG